VSTEGPYLLLFTGTGEHYGYEDGWEPNRVYRYSGEGQVGDMKFNGGNRAIRDHAQHGKDLHLFKQGGKGEGPVRGGASPALPGNTGTPRTSTVSRAWQSSSTSLQSITCQQLLIKVPLTPGRPPPSKARRKGSEGGYGAGLEQCTAAQLLFILPGSRILTP
jgi:hypothetical protein